MKNAEKGKFDQIYILIERYLCPVKPSEYRPSRRFYAGTLSQHALSLFYATRHFRWRATRKDGDNSFSGYNLESISVRKLREKNEWIDLPPSYESLAGVGLFWYSASVPFMVSRLSECHAEPDVIFSWSRRLRAVSCFSPFFCCCLAGITFLAVSL